MLHISIRQKQSKIKARETSRIQTRKTHFPSSSLSLSHTQTQTSAQLRAAAASAQRLPEITLTLATTITMTAHTANNSKDYMHNKNKGNLQAAALTLLMDIHI